MFRINSLKILNLLNRDVIVNRSIFELSSWINSASKNAFNGILGGVKKAADGFMAPNINYNIYIPKTTYFLGEKIEGFIKIEPNEPVEINKLTVTLSSIEQLNRTKYTKKKMKVGRTFTEQVIPEEYVDKAQLHKDSVVCDLNCAMNVGSTRQEPFALSVPLTGRGTFRSINHNVDWSLDLKIESKGRRDLNKSYTIQVAANPLPNNNSMQMPVFIQKETTTEVEVVYCRYCRQKNNARSLYCNKCGAPLH